MPWIAIDWMRKREWDSSSGSQKQKQHLLNDFYLIRYVRHIYERLICQMYVKQHRHTHMHAWSLPKSSRFLWLLLFYAFLFYLCLCSRCWCKRWTFERGKASLALSYRVPVLAHGSHTKWKRVIHKYYFNFITVKSTDDAANKKKFLNWLQICSVCVCVWLNVVSVCIAIQYTHTHRVFASQ